MTPLATNRLDFDVATNRVKINFAEIFLNRIRIRGQLVTHVLRQIKKYFPIKFGIYVVLSKFLLISVFEKKISSDGSKILGKFTESQHLKKVPNSKIDS